MARYTASVTLKISVLCEACEHPYQWIANMSNSTSTSGLLPAKDPEHGLRERIGNLQFGVHRCPKCRYLQSWMRPEWASNIESAAVAIAIPFFLVGGEKLG